MILPRQRMYSEKDFEGLTSEGRKIYQVERDKLAGQTKEKLKACNDKFAKQIENAESVYVKGSKEYNKAIKKIKENWNKEIDGIRKGVESQKYGIKNNLFTKDIEKKPESSIESFVNSFKGGSKKSATKGAEKIGAGEKIKEALKKNKKALLITGGGLTVAGATAAGVKAYKNNKERKAEEEIKNKIRGYGDTKKKA